MRAALDQYAARKGMPVSTVVHNLVIDGLRRAGDLTIESETVTQALVRPVFRRIERTVAWDKLPSE